MKSYLEEIKENLDLDDIANIKVALEYYIDYIYSEKYKDIYRKTLNKMKIEV